MSEPRMLQAEALRWLRHRLDPERLAWLMDAAVRDPLGMALAHVASFSTEDAGGQVLACVRAVNRCRNVGEARAEAARLFGLAQARPGDWWIDG